MSKETYKSYGRSWYQANKDRILKKQKEDYARKMGLSGMSQIEINVREQVAKDIEAYMKNYRDDFSRNITKIITGIARGKK